MTEEKTPWHSRESTDMSGDVAILNSNGRLIAEVFARVSKASFIDAEKRADFVVRACNAYDELVAACEKFSRAHAPCGEDCSMATVDPQDWAEFDAAVKEALL